jgi:hypothetical protein
MYLALETTQWVAIVVGFVCVAALVVIVVAPWRRIRSEPRISDTVETRILLGDDPRKIAEDEEEREHDDGPSGPRAEVLDLDPERRSTG